MNYIVSGPRIDAIRSLPTIDVIDSCRETDIALVEELNSIQIDMLVGLGYTVYEERHYKPAK